MQRACVGRKLQKKKKKKKQKTTKKQKQTKTQKKIFWLPGLPAQCLHFAVQIGLALEADAGQFRHGDETVLDFHAVGEAAERLDQVRIGFVAAQPQSCRDVQRLLMAAVRIAAFAQPTKQMQHVERAQVFDQTVGQRAVELQPVAVRAHAAVADQVASILHREQVFAGRHRLVVVIA